MTNILFLCEKPSQGRDIAKILNCHQKGEGFLRNEDIVVTWCFGHLLATAPPDFYCQNIKPWRIDILPIIPEIKPLTISKSDKCFQAEGQNEKITADKYSCEACKKPLVRRQSKKDQKYFWGCSGYPPCRFTAEDQNNYSKFKTK